MLVCTKGDRAQVRQDFKQQPIEFCDMHKLAPPHAFTASRDATTELFVKLATMSAFPWVLLSFVND